jgi:hypothetical protein
LPFFTRPICIAFASVTIITMLLYVPAVKSRVGSVASTIGGQLRALISGRPSKQVRQP